MTGWAGTFDFRFPISVSRLIIPPGSAWGLVALADFKSVGVAVLPGRVGSIPTRFRQSHAAARSVSGRCELSFRGARDPKNQALLVIRLLPLVNELLLPPASACCVMVAHGRQQTNPAVDLVDL